MFKQALIAAHKKLSRLKASGEIYDFALIGAMALSIYAEPRSTADIDFAFYPINDLNKIAKVLGGSANVGDIFDPLAGVVSFPVNIGKRTVNIQCIRFHPAIETICFEDINEIKFDKIKLRTVSPSTLILLKLYAGSALDLEDAQKVLRAGVVKGTALAMLKRKAQALRLTSRLNAVLRSG